MAYTRTRQKTRKNRQHGAGFFNLFRGLFTRKATSVPAPPQSYNLFPGSLPQPKRTWKNWFLRRKPQPLPYKVNQSPVPVPIQNTVTTYMEQKPSVFQTNENQAYNVISKNHQIQRNMANLNRREYAKHKNAYATTKLSKFTYKEKPLQNVRDAHFASYGWLYTLLKEHKQGRSFSDIFQEIQTKNKQIMITPTQRNELRTLVLEKIYDPTTDTFQRENMLENVFGDEETVNLVQNAYSFYETIQPADGSTPMKPFTHIQRLFGSLFYTDDEYEIILHEDEYHCLSPTGFLPHSLTTSLIPACVYVSSSIQSLLDRFSGEGLFQMFFIGFSPSVLPQSRYTTNIQPYSKLSALEILTSFQPYVDAIKNGMITYVEPRLGLLLQLEGVWTESYPIYKKKTILDRLMILLFQVFVVQRRYELTQNTSVCMEVYTTDYTTYKAEIRNLHWGATSWTNSKWTFNESRMDTYIQQMQTWLLGDDTSKYIYSGYRDKKFDFLFGTDYVEDFEQKDPFILVDTFPWLQSPPETFVPTPLPQEEQVREQFRQTPAVRYITESAKQNQPIHTPVSAKLPTTVPMTLPIKSPRNNSPLSPNSTHRNNSPLSIISKGTVATQKAKFEKQKRRQRRQTKRNRRTR